MGDLQPWLLIGGGIVLMAVGLLLILRPSRKAAVHVGNGNSNVTITNVAGDYTNNAATPEKGGGFQRAVGFACTLIGGAVSAVKLWDLLK